MFQPERRFAASQLLNHPYILSSSDDTPYKSSYQQFPLSSNTSTNQDDNIPRDSTTDHSMPTDGSASVSAKDIDRDRRENSSGSNKIRSHSAPSGVSYTTRVYTGDNSTDG